MLYQWRDFGNCRDMPRNLFFDYELESKQRIPERIKQACMDCPVRTSCLEHAIRHERFGYWANTTAGQRRRLRIKLQTPLTPVQGLYEEEFMTLLAEITVQ